VVLHDGGSADAAKKALLHAALELEDGNFGRGYLDFYGDFTQSDPRNENAVIG
jgi:hypothetical protein